jgi:hypothetical protein
MPVVFETISPYPQEQIEANQKHSHSLGLPLVDTYPVSGPLAIVGGGHSVGQYRYTLQSWSKAWPGSVWALNGAWRWCRDNGIDATFFSFDASPRVAEMVAGADRAILGERADPASFRAMAGKQVWLGEGRLGGSTSAGAAIIAGLKSGHQRVTLFGCEASYQPGASHAYGHWEPEDELVLWSNEMHFVTNPQLLIGAVELATMINSSSNVIRECSGGLLRALCESDFQYEIVGCTEGFQAKLEPLEAA